jgi:hypothetical protein
MSEETNQLLAEIRQGLEAHSETEKPVEPSTPPGDPEKIRTEMAQILAELKQKMMEIDRITADLEKKRKEMDKDSPKKTEKILQEIKVPPLELLK